MREEDFPRALERLKARAKTAFKETGGKYTEGASSPVEGAINFDDSFFCCNPFNRQLSWLSDDVECTDEICDSLTGEVTHIQSVNGTLCNDQNLCTDQDRCTAGECAGSNNRLGALPEDLPFDQLPIVFKIDPRPAR